MGAALELVLRMGRGRGEQGGKGRVLRAAAEVGCEPRALCPDADRSKQEHTAPKLVLYLWALPFLLPSQPCRREAVRIFFMQCSNCIVYLIPTTCVTCLTSVSREPATPHCYFRRH